MKKFLLFGIAAVIAFAFNQNKTYNCETLGLSFKENNKTYNIPNNKQTKKKLKNTLKKLYDVKIKFQKKQMLVYVDGKSDTLDYVKMIDNKVPLYKNKASNLFILVDPKSSQIGLSIPAQKMIIYYQCK
jgi:hypothetical protein